MLVIESTDDERSDLVVVDAGEHGERRALRIADDGERPVGHAHRAHGGWNRYDCERRLLCFNSLR